MAARRLRVGFTVLATGVAVVGAMLGPIATAEAAAGPQLGATVRLAPVAGRIFVSAPGSKPVRLGSPQVVPIRSVIDSRIGTVRVTTATDRAGGTAVAAFQGGRFQVSQPPGQHGTVDVQLVGGNFARCHGASQSRAQDAPIIRYVNTTVSFGHWNVRTRNVTGSGSSMRHGVLAALARAGTASWKTSDTCLGSTITDNSGHVSTRGNGAPLSFNLASAQSISYHCSSAPGVTGSYCAIVQGSAPVEQVNGQAVSDPQVTYTLLARRPVAGQYALLTDGPQNGSVSLLYPLSAPGAGGFRRSDVVCVPDQGAGTYQATWRLNGALLATLDYHAPAASPNIIPCISTPFGRGIPADVTQQQSSAHFAIHYTTDPNLPDHTTDQAVSSLLTEAEGAYTYYTTTLGMPSYVDDGDGKVDIYIETKLSGTNVVDVAPLAGQSTVPAPGHPSAAYIVLKPPTFNAQTVAWDLFYVLSDAVGRDGAQERPGLRFSAATWAADSYLQDPGGVPALDQPLDCNQTCPSSGAWDQWRFYQHLAERFGPTVVYQLEAREAALVQQQPNTSQMDQALQDVISADGSSLAAELPAYELENLTGAWQAPWITGSFANGSSGITTAPLNPHGATKTYTVTVRHLSAQYLKVTVAPLGPCVADTLTFSTTVPSGGAAPGAEVDGISHAVDATPSGSTEVVQVSFNSCNGVTVRLPLVNVTTNTDGLMFSVQASLAPGS